MSIFKSVDLAALKKTPDLTNLLDQTLMVYQHGGTNFELTAKISLPFLAVEAEPARTHDRWQITIRPIPDQMTPGELRRHLVLQTNDPEFPGSTCRSALPSPPGRLDLQSKRTLGPNPDGLWLLILPNVCSLVQPISRVGSNSHFGI